MMNDDERVHESTDNGGGAPGDGPKKKRRRRRRGRGRDSQDGTTVGNVADSGDGLDDDSEDDSSTEVGQSRQPVGRQRDNARSGPSAQDNGGTDEQGRDDAESREKRKRRRKRRRSSDAPDAEGRELGADDVANESGEKPAQQERRPRSGDRPADQDRRQRNGDRPADQDRRQRSDDDDRPADDDSPADDRVDDRDRRDGRRRTKSRGREQRDRRDAVPKGPSALQRRLVRIDGPREDLLAEPVIPVATQVQASSVEGYIQHHKGWQREVLMRLRDILRAAAPEAVESIKWSQPVFELEGPMCYFKAFSNHINFGFWRGAELNDPEHLLEGDGLKMRHVRITAVNDVNVGAYEALVRHAVKLNLEKGDPTA